MKKIIIALLIVFAMVSCTKESPVQHGPGAPKPIRPDLIDTQHHG